MSDFSNSAYFNKSFKPTFVTQMRKRTFGEGDKDKVTGEKPPEDIQPKTNPPSAITLSELTASQELQATPTSQAVHKHKASSRATGLGNLAPTHLSPDKQATPTSQLVSRPKTAPSNSGLGNLAPTQLSPDRQATPTSRPIPKPRTKKSSVPSRNGSSGELFSSAPRPRPRSFNGEDSFVLVEPPVPAPRSNTPVKQVTEEPTVPAPRSNTPVKQVTEEPTARVRVYSKGTEEYKAHKKSQQQQSGADPLECTPHKTPPKDEKVAKGPTMFSHLTPDYMLDESPRSLIQILDLDIETSMRNRYVKREESIDSDEETNVQIGMLEGVVNQTGRKDDTSMPLSQLTKSSETSTETTRRKSPPPAKPPRSPLRGRSKSPGDGKISINALSTDPSLDPTLPITRSQTCSELGTSPKPKKKWSDLSPFSKRKNKNPPSVTSPPGSSREPDSESVISEAGTLSSAMFPLHKTKQPRKLQEVLSRRPSIDVNERDYGYNTPLHYILKKDRPEKCGLIMVLLQTGRVDIDALDEDDNTPLHIAASKNYPRCAALLLAFNANPFLKNRQGHYPLDLAKIGSPLFNLLNKQTERVDNDPVTLSSLPEATAPVDPQELANEKIGRLLQPDKIAGFMRKMDDEIKELERKDFDQSYEAQPMSLRQLSAEEEDMNKCLSDQKFYLNVWKRTSGSRVLFLDGGGIRGLLQIELLMELEKMTGRSIIELFDWIIGTSTGGIVALGLVYGGKTLKEMRQLYFKIKNDVFGGAGIAGTFMNMQQKSRNLERILKKELGEDILMNSVKHPRVMICTVNKEKIPLKVIFFNNFMLNTPELTEVPVWAAARATSAAPMYFTEFDKKYVDGGVKANNPCEFAMTQINQYDRAMGLPARHFAVAVSIGTGIFPNRSLGDGKEFGMFNLKKQVKFLKQLTELFMEAVGESEMTAEKFSVWCQQWRDPIPFFRFNPTLQNVVSPGETDDEKLIDMILDTKQYIADPETREKFKNLVKVFKRLQSDKS